MEVFNFKVENLHRGIQLFQANFINKSIFAILELQLIVDMQIFGSNPALALHEEGMTDGSGNGFALDLQVYQLVLFVAEKANNTFQGAFTSCGIFSPYQLIRLDFFNRNQTIFGMDQRASNKAMITGNAASNETANSTTKEAVSGTINSSFKRIIPASSFNTALNSTSNCTADSTRDRTLCHAKAAPAAKQATPPVATVATTAAPTISAAPMATLAQLGRDQESASSLLLTGSFIQ